jgi:hypothetical protein
MALSLHLAEFERRSGSEPLRGRARERYLDEYEEALMERARENREEEPGGL